MIIETVLATFQDIHQIVKENKDYFGMDIQDKRKIFIDKYPGYPILFATYYTNADSTTFIEDINKLLHSMNDNNDNDIIKSAIGFLTYEFSSILDIYDIYGEETTEKLDLPDSALRDYLVNFLEKDKSYTEIISEIRKEISLYTTPKSVVVQSAIKLHPKIRSEIREQLMNEEEFILVEYQNKPGLLGGIKIMMNGYLYDNSWSSMINSINLPENYE